ncbi:MAG TPA: extracellular solute-binding protein [Turneriella sp.]|nr:extracellular solute-binding protein [Turneriella sp.]
MCTLTLWHSYNNEETRVFNALVADFEKAHPQIKIKAERVPFDGLLPKLTSAAIAHRTPDIARVDIGHVARLAWGHVISPLNQLRAEETVGAMLPIAAKVASVKTPRDKVAQLYAIPDQLTTVALYYNKKILAELQVTPPKTLGDLHRIGKIFRERGKSHKALGINASLWWAMPWLFLYNARVMNDTLDRCLLNSGESIAAIEALRTLYTEGTEGGAWLSGAINPDQGFLTGRYAMILSGPWNLKTFQKIPFGVRLVPAHGKKISASNIGGSAMVVFAASPRKSEAYQFLSYLVSEPVQKKWIQETGQLSVNARANQSLEHTFSPELKTFLRQLEFAEPRPQLPGYDTLETIVAPYL